MNILNKDKIEDYMQKKVKVTSKIGTLKVCPRCLSTDLVPLSSISGWLVQEMYKCNKCNYRGFVLEISEEDIKRDKQ